TRRSSDLDQRLVARQRVGQPGVEHQLLGAGGQRLGGWGLQVFRVLPGPFGRCDSLTRGSCAVVLLLRCGSLVSARLSELVRLLERLVAVESAGFGGRGGPLAWLPAAASTSGLLVLLLATDVVAGDPVDT